MPEDLILERIKKQIPALTYIVTEGAADVEAVSFGGTDYDVLSNAGSGNIQFLYEGYIDISGWTTMLENTFWPQATILQRSANYLMTNAATGTDSIYDAVFVMPRELTTAEKTRLSSMSLVGFISGMSGVYYGANGVDLQHVLFGQWNFASTNTTHAPACTILDTDKFGSGEPTLANRLYVYRFAYAQVANATGVTFPPVNLFIEGAFGKEDEYERLERLRRTFVLSSDQV